MLNIDERDLQNVKQMCAQVKEVNIEYKLLKGNNIVFKVSLWSKDSYTQAVMHRDLM